MPRDLFADNGIDVPINSSQDLLAPQGRDLFAEMGVNIDQPPELGILDQIVGSSPLQFTLGAGDSVNNLARGVANFLTPQSMQVPLLKTGQGLSYEAGDLAGDIGGFIAGGGALNAAREAAEAIPIVGQAAKALSGSGFSGSAMARRGLGSALYGAIDNPDERLQSSGIGGGVSVLLDTLLKGGSKLIPSNYFRGKLSPEELQQNLSVTQGSKTDLGSVIGSPLLKRLFENKLSKSQVGNDAMADQANFVVNKGNDLLARYLGDAAPEDVSSSLLKSIGSTYNANVMKPGEAIINKYIGSTNPEDISGQIGEEIKKYYTNNVVSPGASLISKYLGATAPEDINHAIGKALTDAATQQNILKRELYKEVDNLAESEALKLELPNFSKLAKDYSELIKSQHFLQFEPNEKALLYRLSNYQNPVKEIESKLVDKSGKPFVELKYPTLKEANIMAGTLGQLSRKYAQSPASWDRNMSSVLSNMGKTLKNDISQTIQNNGSEQLKTVYQKAEQNYAKNYSPFLEKDIYKFTSGKKTADKIIPTFLKTGNVDEAEQLSKLISKLPDDKKDLLKYAYLSKAVEGNESQRLFNPDKLKEVWNGSKLGDNQKRILFPDKTERKLLDDYTNVVDDHKIISSFANGKKTSDTLLRFIKNASGNDLSFIMSKLPNDKKDLIKYSYLSDSLKGGQFNPMKFDQLLRELPSDKKKVLFPNKEEKFVFNAYMNSLKENRHLTPFISGDKSADDILSTYLKSGNSDKVGTLKKITSILTPSERDLLKYEYFSRALEGTEGARTVNPNKLKTLWSDRSLGPKQKKELVSDKKERQALNDYVKLTSMSNESLNRMLNPMTGQRGLDFYNQVKSNTLGAMIGAGAGSMLAGPAGLTIGGLIGGYGGDAVANRIANSLVNRLTSPNYRQNFVEKMISPSKTPENIGRFLTPTILNAINQTMR